MPTLLDHVREQGRVPFAQRPFDALDSLALTQIVYMPMEGLPGDTTATVASLWARLTQDYPNAFADPFQRKRYYFTGACAQAERYAGLAISAYVNHVDPAQETQFCTATFRLPDGARYVALRGTDLTLAGWKEDLNMSFKPVPAQGEAVAYLNAAAAFGGPLMAGGHSKGGHLALFAAAHAAPETQARLARVYSFDGPGVDQATLTGEGYARVGALMESYIPQSSVVGMLLCYHPVFTVVRSNAIGLLQHDALSWQVRDGAFETVDGLDLGTRMADEALRLWIDRLTPDDRFFLTETVFRIISTLDAETIDPLVQDPAGSTVRMFSAFRRLEPETRVRTRRILGDLFTSGANEAARLLLPGTFRRFVEPRGAAPAQPGAAAVQPVAGPSQADTGPSQPEAAPAPQA